MSLLFALCCTVALTAPKNAVDLAEPLAVADRFLSMWQARKGDDALELLSPRLLEAQTRARLREWIVGLSNPHNAAFEVGSPAILSSRKVAFRVRLYFRYTGRPDRDRPAAGRMVLVRDANGRWLIDSLPA